MTEQTILPYGLWPSPITAGWVSQRLVFEDVQFASDSQTLVWAEGRSAARALVAQQAGGAPQYLTDEQSPRGGVGYGGGAFATARHTDLLVFANSDGRLYRRGLKPEKPRAITPEIGPNGSVASPAISEDGRWVVYVYSDGKNDFLGLCDSSGQGWPIQLAQGADFYMQPAWHPDGTRLAWVEWNHPNMPWDGTRIILASLEGSPPRVTAQRMVGGGDDIPAQQPRFSPDGRWLSFLEERGEWADLVLIDLTTGQRSVLVRGNGFELAPPAWNQGLRTTGWSPSSQRFYYLRYDGPDVSLWQVDISTGQSLKLDTGSYTWLGQLSVSPTGEELAMQASAANLPDVLLLWRAGASQVVAHSMPATVAPAYLPAPRPMEWSDEDGLPVHALYYPPSNPTYGANGRPPAIIHIHGGPTSMVANRFISEAAYFTSRGYAYVELNYRGSTGYGRRYRHAMRQRWGEVEVEDCAACARALDAQGLADSHRLVITGGSAGGYTVLNTLIRYPGLYKAGICQYGVTNLFALDLDTHKFEAHYNASMIGPLPEAAARYQAWSPIYHASSIRNALYIFQGSLDKVVPPSQAEEIVKALRAHGIPHKYKLYEGEGHGFRKSETIADYLKETERFLLEHVLFAP